ncbi:uncharacterized protein PAC_18869 [Phialocephala subalpina]|uniref:Uncharacterized protein n=1 Tax=Phialocephala subalpina TaxID=576137 RepID=A0A1L7XVD4_9HELO|nr:uncharacterized protein PAC_18869 [Phialocephala subalpina]
MTRFSTAQRRRNKMQASETRSIGPWRALRIALRIVLFSALAWLVLALLWAFLPSPAMIKTDGHVASILRAGKSLTRVYPAEKWHTGRSYDRRGFALEYTLNPPTAAYPAPRLAISGSDVPIPLYNFNLPNNETEIDMNPDFEFKAVARIGDRDGANLPWFKFADSILLFWWIHRENMDMSLTATWELGEDSDVPGVQNQRFEILLFNPHAHSGREPLVSIDTSMVRHGKEGATVDVVSASLGEESDSPTWTYPLRVAIILVLAPTSIFVNDWFGPILSAGYSALGTALIIAIGVLIYGFIILAIVVSFWKCFRGPSLETMVGRVQGRLDMWRESGRFSWARIDIIQDGLDRIHEEARVQAVLRVCREGWHPERERERRAREQGEEAEAIEKGGVKIRIRREWV